MSFLEIRGLYKNLREFSLESISLDLEQGRYLTLVGPTGAGKTILLECIIGFYLPDRGSVTLNGEDITRKRPEKRNIGIVYQDYALMPHMNVYKNIAYGLRKKTKQKIPEKVQEISESLHIDHLLHRMPKTLSGGEQQRAALARSLVVRPRLLLMDEPLSALDPSTKKDLRRMLRRAIKKYGTTVIHVTHDMDDVWTLGDEAAVMHEGHIEQKGLLGDVLERPCTDFVAEFVGCTVLEGKVLSRENGLTEVDISGTRLISYDRAEPGEKIRAIIRPENIILSRTTPEKVSARNVLATRVLNIEPENGLNIVRLGCADLALNVIITNNGLHDLELRPGEEICAMIKCIHVRLA